MELVWNIYIIIQNAKVIDGISVGYVKHCYYLTVNLFNFIFRKIYTSFRKSSLNFGKNKCIFRKDQFCLGNSKVKFGKNYFNFRIKYYIHVLNLFL